MFQHIFRDRNDFADAVATIPLLLFVSQTIALLSTKIELKDKPSFYLQIDEIDIFEERTWLTDMRRYFKNRTFYSNAKVVENKRI